MILDLSSASERSCLQEVLRVVLIPEMGTLDNIVHDALADMCH